MYVGGGRESVGGHACRETSFQLPSVVPASPPSFLTHTHTPSGYTSRSGSPLSPLLFFCWLVSATAEQRAPLSPLLCVCVCESARRRVKDTTSSARVSQPLPSMVFLSVSPHLAWDPRLSPPPLPLPPSLSLSYCSARSLSPSVSLSVWVTPFPPDRALAIPASLSLSPHWCVLIPFFHQALGPIGRLPSNHYLHSSTPLSSFLALRALSTSFPHCRSHLSSRKNDLHAGGERNFAVRKIKERLKPGEQEEKFTEKTAAGR